MAKRIDSIVLSGTENKFTVATKVETSPANGARADGGTVLSSFEVGGVQVTATSFQVLKAVGELHSTGRITVFNKGTGGIGGAEEKGYFDFGSNGDFSMAGTITAGGLHTTGDIACDGSANFEGSALVKAGRNTGVKPWQSASNNFIYMSNTTNDTAQGSFVNVITGGWYNAGWQLGGVRGSGIDLSQVQLNVNGGGASGKAFVFGANGVASCQQWADTSDERLKYDIEVITDPLEKMGQFHGVTFAYKNGGLRAAGYIAQEVQKVLPEAVKEGSDGYLSLNTGGVAAIHHEAILALLVRVEYLEARLGLQPGEEVVSE